ncbi:hypothetical protein [Geotalea uraniireducens]|uniref:hypothetical protein n=1 Tax=Geotalea uraniireducens TaxID=351604 RepID=UPI00059DE917|nr:hypothetical protein [Geotalea uraniireducens]
MKSKSMTTAALIVSIVGITLHIYLTCFHTPSGSFYFLIVPLMNMIPYLICIVLIKTVPKPTIPLCAGLLLLIFDLYLFESYLFSTKTYRYQFVEVYQIMFKAAVIVPIGCLIGNLLDKVIRRQGGGQ